MYQIDRHENARPSIFGGGAIKAHMIDTVLYTIEIVLVGGCGTHAPHLNDKSNTGAVGA